jgi:hypothetical protein
MESVKDALHMCFVVCVQCVLFVKKGSKMRFSYVFQVLAVFAVVFSVAPVQAGLNDEYKPSSKTSMKHGKYVWGTPSHDETRLYLNEAKIPHNSQWADDQWTPQNWIDARGGSAMAVIKGLYDAGIVLDQYVDDVPVLVVGRPFLELSGLEKRRVTAFFDHVFEITAGADNGVFNVVFVEEKFYGMFRETADIGYFNASGLYLQ